MSKYLIKFGFDFSNMLSTKNFDQNLNEIVNKNKKIIEIMRELKKPINERIHINNIEETKKELVRVELNLCKDEPDFIKVLIDIQYKEIFDYICYLIANPDDRKSVRNPLIVENLIDVADGEEIYKIEKDLNYDLNRESFNMEVFKNTFERRFVLLSNLFWKSKEISI